MKFLLTILFACALSCEPHAQTINWVVGNESAVNAYVIENNSKDTVSGWQPFATLAPGQTSYTYPIPDRQFYWRIAAIGKDSFFTPAKLYTVILGTSITNWGVVSNPSNVIVYWTSQNESGIKNYEIDRSYDGVNFSSVATVAPQGNVSYSILVNRPTTTTQVCSRKIFNWCISHKNVTVINTAKGIYEIISVNLDGSKTILKTISG